MAKKYRARSKAELQQLENDTRKSEMRHDVLTRYVASLKHEVYLLKTELFRHRDCGDERIQQYIDSSANAIVERRLSAIKTATQKGDADTSAALRYKRGKNNS